LAGTERGFAGAGKSGVEQVEVHAPMVAANASR
jgi:hypothetical protein